MGRAGIEPETLGLRMYRDIPKSLVPVRALPGMLGWINNGRLTQGPVNSLVVGRAGSETCPANPRFRGHPGKEHRGEHGATPRT